MDSDWPFFCLCLHIGMSLCCLWLISCSYKVSVVLTQLPIQRPYFQKGSEINYNLCSLTVHKVQTVRASTYTFWENTIYSIISSFFFPLGTAVSFSLCSPYEVCLHNTENNWLRKTDCPGVIQMKKKFRIYNQSRNPLLKDVMGGKHFYLGVSVKI